MSQFCGFNEIYRVTINEIIRETKRNIAFYEKLKKELYNITDKENFISIIQKIKNHIKEETDYGIPSTTIISDIKKLFHLHRCNSLFTDLYDGDRRLLSIWDSDIYDKMDSFIENCKSFYDKLSINILFSINKSNYTYLKLFTQMLEHYSKTEPMNYVYLHHTIKKTYHIASKEINRILTNEIKCDKVYKTLTDFKEKEIKI